jgi:lipopolysaccharide/colanic/teichoic acid biosynthesis glycosyltransferase
MRWIEDTSDCDQNEITCPKYWVIKSGYFGYTPWSFVTITIFNAVLSALLIVVGLPLFICIGAAIYLRDRGPIFYKGLRLGLSQTPFYMYKFRTLPVGSQKVVGNEVLSHKHMTVTPFSRFLRNTRLDELPQLFNIIKGDMDFVGPRPIRPEIYAEQAKLISDYDKRFAVRPGLIGYAQLFTPHSSPKRLRAHIDNKFVHRRRSRLWDILVIIYTILLVARDIVVKGSKLIWQELVLRRIMRLYNETRKFDRIRLNSVQAYIVTTATEKGSKDKSGIVYDINEECFRIETSLELDESPILLRIESHIRRGFKRKYKRAIVHGKVFKRMSEEGAPKNVYIISYEPYSPLNGYLLDQYFLRKSIV